MQKITVEKNENNKIQKVLNNFTKSIGENDFDNAGKILTNGLSRYPNSPSLIFSLGKYYELKGWFKDPYMEKTYKDYLKITGNDGVYHDDAIFSILEYHLSEAIKNDDTQLEEKGKLLALLNSINDKTTLRFNLTSGLYYMFVENYELASNFLSKVPIDRVPYTKCKWIYNNLGYALMKKHKYPEAIKPLEIAVFLDPTNIRARQNLAWDYCMLGNFKESVKQYGLILQLDPNNKKALEGKKDCEGRQ
jgi:tetratricopeptide (TPR) repeat protein